MSNALRLACAMLLHTGAWVSIASACSETVTIPDDPDPGEYRVMDISMFGAVPDNACSDHFAFEAAAQWFNDRHGNGELHFRDGLYIVGHQDQGMPPGLYKEGRSPLHFFGCSNLTLVGGDDTRIKFDDCLYYGAFDHTNGDALIYPCGVACATVEDMTTIGICIHLERCSQVSITDLTLDGNMNNVWIGGAPNGGEGTQLQHTGIVLDDSWEVSLDRLNVYQFCLDGMYIVAKVDSVFEHGDDMRISAHDCSFSRNGRNGFSWMGGSGVDLAYCRFELNGTYLVRSQPGAGVDIEYHGFVFTYDSAPIGNGRFTACTFKYNKGCGLISDVGAAYLPYVPGPFQFFSCRFIGSEGGVALWPNAPKMRFDYCRIHGRTVVPFDCQLTGDLEDRTQFNLCDFDETYYDPDDDVRYSMSWHSWDGYDHMIQADRNTGHGGVTFDLCTFHTYCRLMPFAIWGGPALTGEPNYHAKMLGCTYIYEGAHIPGIPPPPVPGEEYTAYSGQFSNTEVDSLTLHYPSSYVWTLISTDIQIIQAWDHASMPDTVHASLANNLILDPAPSVEFPLYQTCPEPYMDPIAAYYMCAGDLGECDTCDCVLHIPPPEGGPDCPAEKVSASPAGSSKRSELVKSRSGLVRPVGADAVKVRWLIYDCQGRPVADLSNLAERDAVVEHLASGVYVLTRLELSSGKILGQSRFFKP